MIIARELLFGQIAISKKFISQKELDECLALQKENGLGLSIGEILHDRGYMNDESIEAVIKLQDVKIKEAAGRPISGTAGDSLFGTLAVTMKYTTLPKIVECMKEQDRLERLNIHMRLGEILLSKGYLSVTQVKELINRQRE